MTIIWTATLKPISGHGSVSMTIEAPNEAIARRLIAAYWGHAMTIVDVKEKP